MENVMDFFQMINSLNCLTNSPKYIQFTIM